MVPFCAYESECPYKKHFKKENTLHPETRYAICTWKDHCNQQVSHPEVAHARRHACAHLLRFYRKVSINSESEALQKSGMRGIFQKVLKEKD